MIAALRYEWVRIRTVRSSWLLSALVIAVCALIAFFVADAAPRHARPSDYLDALTGGLQLGAVFMALIGVLAAGHEYRHDTIRTTLSAVPRRFAVFVAKAAVVTVWSLVVTGLAVGACWLVVTATARDKFGSLSLTAAPGPRVFLGAVLLVVVWTLVGYAYAGLFRNVTASVVVLLALPLGVEPLLQYLLDTHPLASVEGLARFLPFTAAAAMTATSDVHTFGGDRILPWQGAVTAGSYAAGLLVLALAAFEKRDA